MKKKTKTSFLKHVLLVALLAIASLANGPCSTVTRDDKLKNQRLRYGIGTPGGGNPWAKQQLLKVIDGAQREVLAVFQDLNDAEVTNALIRKAQKGLAVAVAGDQRNEDKNPGFANLKALRTQDMFLDQRTAVNKSLQYDASTVAGKAARDRVLRTRLNFNRQNRSLKYNASAYDGRVEYNIVIADRTECWVSTGGANTATFNGGAYSIVFHFSSFDICNDLANEAHQLVWGGLFADEGEPSFGLFRHSKSQVDPNMRFTLDHLRFHLWFAPQEKPLVATITELMRAEKSITFAARALTQDIINDVATHSANRSHILNVFEYHARKPQTFGVPFRLKGVFGNEVGSADSSVSSPWTNTSINYNALMSNTCSTINGVSINLPYIDDNGVAVFQNASNQTSIHCDLLNLRNNINGGNSQSETIAIRKHSQSLPFNLFNIDTQGRHPRIIIMFSDLRKRYYYDAGNSQDAEPKRTRNDFFPLTDSLVMMIEPMASEATHGIFTDMAALADFIYEDAGSGGDTW